MANSLYQFNFEHDQQPTENQYPINDVQWIYVNDINQANYSNGKKSVIVRLRLHPSLSHSLAPFSLWYHIVVSRSNY